MEQIGQPMFRGCAGRGQDYPGHNPMRQVFARDVSDALQRVLHANIVSRRVKIALRATRRSRRWVNGPGAPLPQHRTISTLRPSFVWPIVLNRSAFVECAESGYTATGWRRIFWIS